jgi:hypothetical protein
MSGLSYQFLGIDIKGNHNNTSTGGMRTTGPEFMAVKLVYPILLDLESEWSQTRSDSQTAASVEKIQNVF